MGVNIGNKALKDAYIGNKPIKKIYLGNKLLWQRLPYEAEIEYLEGSGTQYIDTEFIPNYNTRLECEYLVKGSNTHNAVLGCADSTNASDAKNGVVILNLLASNGTPTRYGFGNGSGTMFQSDAYSQLNTEYKVYFDKNNVYINDTLVKTLPTSEWTANNPLRLFGRAPWNTYLLVGYIKYCKIWDGETLVRDYIPVRVGQIGYMYDKISGQLFGNSGTGNFILGNDI